MVFSMIHPRQGGKMQTVFSCLFNTLAFVHIFFFHLFRVLSYIFMHFLFITSHLCNTFISPLFCILPFWPSVQPGGCSEIVSVSENPCGFSPGYVCVCVCVGVRPATDVRSSLPFRWMCGVVSSQCWSQCLFQSSRTLWQCYICTFKILI